MQRTRSQPAGPAAGRCPDAGASDLEAREGVAEMWAGPKDGSKESGRVREEPRRPHPGWDWPDALHVHNLHRRAHATLRSPPPPPPVAPTDLPTVRGQGGGGVSQEWHRCDACAASTAAAASTASVVATAATRDTKLSQTQAGTGAFGGPAQTRLCAQPAAQPRGTTRGTRRGTTGRAPRSHHSRRASTSPREDTCRRGFMKCDRLTAVRAGGAVHRHAGAAFRPRAAARRPRAGCGSCRCRGLGLRGEGRGVSD